jgi:hypothetical protein
MFERSRSRSSWPVRVRFWGLLMGPRSRGTVWESFCQFATPKILRELDRSPSQMSYSSSV